MTRAALLLALALVAGCVAVAPEPVPDYHVRIDTVTGWGSGALVDSTTVLTVGHVVDRVDEFCPIYVYRGRERRRAYVSERSRGSTQTIEPVVRLKLTKPLSVGPVALRRIAKGDSGTPVLGKGGAIVGFISGWAGPSYKWAGRTGSLYVVTPCEPMLYRESGE